MEPSTSWSQDTYERGFSDEYSSDINTRLRDGSGKGKEVALNDPNTSTTRPSPHSWNNETIDFTYNPIRRKDITIHLNLDIQEDLSISLETLSRLSRLGDFKNAKTHFDLELKEHLDKPYVFVQWAATLLNQGDYKSIAELDVTSMQHLESKAMNDNDTKLFLTYWRLINLTTRLRRLEVDNSDKDWEVLDDVLEDIHDYASMTSTEVCLHSSTLILS